MASIAQPPDNGFILWGAALVFIMTPGLSLFYSGLSRSKNALHMIMITMCAMCVVTIQWVIFGFSLSFSEWDSNDGRGSSFIGNTKYFGLSGLGIEPLPNTAPAVSGITFMLYQMQFATITAALIFGSVSERIRLLPTMLFVFLWTTLIYDPIAYWTFSWRGWIHNLACIDAATGPKPCGNGSLDFAGGGPVHMASGFAGLAFCLYIGKRTRQKYHSDEEANPELDYLNFLPHQIVNVVIGTALLWFGWFGFNGGSALANSSRAGMAGAVTHIAAASGAITWPLFDLVFANISAWKARSQVMSSNNTEEEKAARIRDINKTIRFSAVGFCSGAVAGLVAITPASGFVAPWAAIVFGFSAGVLCNAACRMKRIFGFDDSLDGFAEHGIGGFVGSILTGVFAQKFIPESLDGTTTVLGGWLDGHWIQVWWQLAGALATIGYSFVGTYILVLFTDFVTGFNLRMTAEEEEEGGDISEIGEVAYHYAKEYIHGHLIEKRTGFREI